MPVPLMRLPPMRSSSHPLLPVIVLLILHLNLPISPSVVLAARPLINPNKLSASDLLRPSLHGIYTGAAAGVWEHFKSLLNAGPGDTRASLGPLKRYFARFGYLNHLDDSSSSSTLFDSPTLSALQLYQQSFHLPVTGKLDMPTLLKIMTPRCGREDVAEGIPLMLQKSPPSPAQAEVGRYAFFPSTPSWPETRRNLTYAFNAMNETQRLSAEERGRVFANAFREWAAVVPMEFTEVAEYGDADIKIEFVAFEHGDEEPFDGVLGILAHAFSPTDGRFHLDDSEMWSVGGGSSSSSRPVPSQQIDLQSVVTHEIGHLIGLAHSPVENAIMYPSLGPGQVKLQLQADDIQGAQALYGVNPDYDPSRPLPGIPPPTILLPQSDVKPLPIPRLLTVCFFPFLPLLLI